MREKEKIYKKNKNKSNDLYRNLQQKAAAHYEYVGLTAYQRGSYTTMPRCGSLEQFWPTLITDTTMNTWS